MKIERVTRVIKPGESPYVGCGWKEDGRDGVVIAVDAAGKIVVQFPAKPRVRKPTYTVRSRAENLCVIEKIAAR